jgi:hypothetical protein
LKHVTNGFVVVQNKDGLCGGVFFLLGGIIFGHGSSRQREQTWA